MNSTSEILEVDRPMIGKRRIYGLPRIFLEKAFKIFDVENSLFILYSYLLGFVNKKQVRGASTPLPYFKYLQNLFGFPSR